MTDYKEISLGPEALEYIRGCLENGKTLAHNLLERPDLKSGTIITALPSNVKGKQVNGVTKGKQVNGVRSCNRVLTLVK